MGLASDAAAMLAVASGGTGATTALAARQNIGGSGVRREHGYHQPQQSLWLGHQHRRGSDEQAGDEIVVGAVRQHRRRGAACGNKTAVTDSAAQLFETAIPVRAQAGCWRATATRISVSAAGASWAQALDVDPATGHVGLAGYTADANNALGVLGTAFLFTAATDSCRFTFNKVAVANDASLTFETNFSARALAGLLGSDGYQLKVSPDGSTFHQVYVADQTTGNLAIKALLSAASYTVASLPAGFNGALAFASNGRKSGEAAGAGTGVMAVFSTDRGGGCRMTASLPLGRDYERPGQASPRSRGLSANFRRRAGRAPRRHHEQPRSGPRRATPGGFPAARFKVPTQTVLTTASGTAGAGTYAPPAGASWLRVRMVAGGGGGAGSGASAGAGSVGGVTSFGS